MGQLLQLLLAITCLVFFFVWPVYLYLQNLRGGLLWLCIVMPYLAWWAGYLYR